MPLFFLNLYQSLSPSLSPTATLSISVSLPLCTQEVFCYSTTEGELQAPRHCTLNISACICKNKNVLFYNKRQAEPMKWDRSHPHCGAHGGQSQCLRLMQGLWSEAGAQTRKGTKGEAEAPTLLRAVWTPSGPCTPLLGSRGHVLGPAG